MWPSMGHCASNKVGIGEWVHMVAHSIHALTDLSILLPSFDLLIILVKSRYSWSIVCSGYGR